MPKEDDPRYAARSFGALFLIAAPFVGDGGWSSDDLWSSHKLGARLPQDAPVHIYHGMEDDIVPPSHAELYARAVPQARVHPRPTVVTAVSMDCSTANR
jgi:pimeloyl-ACP methyl ester carboxylesterase